MYHYTPDPNVVYPNDKALENNPFGNFKQMTSQLQQNRILNNFNEAFSMNDPMIEKQNYGNMNNMYHNNVSNPINSEFTVNYMIDIDSKDRDITVYPDPFAYNVIFSPASRETTTRTEWIDPKNKSLGTHVVTTTYNSQPRPYIGKVFRNVKYIRIDSVVLPKYYGIVEDSGTWIMDTSKDLTKDRYIVMKIKNIDSKYNLSTNSVVETTGVKLIPDTIPPTSNFYYAIPTNSNNIIKTFNSSALGNIDRLNFEFYDSCGNLLSFNNLDSTQDTTDVRNPLNINLQHDMTLVFGVVENEIATNVSYNH